MTDKLHKDFIDSDLHVASVIGSSDPGAVGAGKQWVDTTDGTGLWVLKTRNEANTGWLFTPSGGLTPLMGVAQAGQTTQQYISTTLSYVNCDNVIYDPDSTITTGVGAWKWTAPYDCWIIAHLTLLRQNGGSMYFWWQIDTVNMKLARGAGSNSWTEINDTILYPMSAGEYLQMKIYGSGSYLSHAGYTNFSIFWMAQ